MHQQQLNSKPYYKHNGIICNMFALGGTLHGHNKRLAYLYDLKQQGYSSCLPYTFEGTRSKRYLVIA